MTAPSDRDRASLPSGCNPSRIDAKRGDHFLQADLPGLELALPRLNFYCVLPCFTIPLLERTSRRISMNNLDHLLQRNKEFAAQQSAEGTLMPSLSRAMPNVKAVIIGCADMRVDPAHVLGIKPGEAVVLRNIGGRINPGLLE